MLQHSHGDAPIQIRSERRRSSNPKDFAEISRTDEQWRYVNVADLNGLDKPLAAFNGKISEISHLVGKDDPRIGSIGIPEDLIAAQVWSVPDAVRFFKLDSTTDTIHSVIEADDKQQSLQIFVETTKHTTSKLILEHTGEGDLAEVVEIDIADDSDLTLISIQNVGDFSAFTSSHFIRVGRNAKFTHIVVTLSGSAVRIVPSVSFGGPGGSVKLLGAYFANSGQYIENRPFVDHNQPHCISDVSYKGALQGESAHTVWVGDVLIRKAAEGTKTYELNRNLLLTDGARADSVPNLEIETGQIEGAGHASASGRFDDEQLFYLQARGISQADAKRLVVKGFLNDVVSQIGDEILEAKLTAQIASKLDEGSK